MLDKILSRQHFEIFFFFFPQNRSVCLSVSLSLSLSLSLSIYLSISRLDKPTEPADLEFFAINITMMMLIDRHPELKS